MILALVLFPVSGVLSNDMSDLDRTGSVFVSPKLGFTFPVGALASGNFQSMAASWRKEGISLSAEVGYYLSNSTIGGMEIAYSTFNPKRLAAFALDGSQDKSRVRIRRFEIYLQYQVVQTGRYRPFLKLAAGFFDISRISMPVPYTNPLVYQDYSLGSRPVFSTGFGITANLTRSISVAFSVEAVDLNSYSGTWETSGATIGPLATNMLFFPVYFSVAYHLSE